MVKRTVIGAVLTALVILGMAGYAAEDGSTVEVSWSAQTFIQLTIDQLDVDLGTLDIGLYDAEADAWTALESENHTGFVLSNYPGGYVLTVQAANSGEQNADLDRFMIRGWDIGDWTPLNQVRTLGTRGNAGRQNVDDIGYRYEPSWDDEPGEYVVQVTFTATTQ